MHENEISAIIVDAAIKVHKALGPGLLESAYQACLAFELREAGLNIVIEKSLPVIYRAVQLDCGYRIDILAEQKVILEIKSVGMLHDIHAAQLLTYLKLSDCKLGLLLNFNVVKMVDGIKRIVNKL